MAMITPNIPINNRLYFNMEGASLSLEVSERTIRRDINKQKIQYFHHPSKGYLFLPEWLDEWIARRTKQPRKYVNSNR